MLGAGPWSRGSCVCWEGYVSHGYWEVFAPSAGHAGAFWVRMEACWTAKLLMCAQNVRQRRPFFFVSRGFENEGVASGERLLSRLC